MPRLFWKEVRKTIFSLKNKGGWIIICIFPENINNCDFLAVSELKFVLGSSSLILSSCGILSVVVDDNDDDDDDDDHDKFFLWHGWPTNSV